MNTFRLSQGQLAHTLFALGAATATTNVQGRGEYIRLADVIAQGCAPQTGGSLELNLTEVQCGQIRLAVAGARGVNNTPPEYGRWLTEVEQLFQGNPAQQPQTAGASSG